jgi:hypothetical protein
MLGTTWERDKLTLTLLNRATYGPKIMGWESKEGEQKKQ